MPHLLPTRKGYTALKRGGVDCNSRVPHSVLTLDDLEDVLVCSFVPGSASAGMRTYAAADGRQSLLARSGARRTASGPVYANYDDGAEFSTPFDFSEDNTLADDLRISTSSFLEEADWPGRATKVALEFDGSSITQKAIEVGTDPEYDDDPRVASNVLTVSADGGPVCRRTMTVVTLTLSAEFLRSRQTPLMPMLYILSGDNSLHSGIGRRLRHVLQAMLDATYFERLGGGGAGGGQDVEYGVDAVESRAPTAVSLRPPVILVGDFAMQDHFLSMTGGQDRWRCQLGWPCPEEDFATHSTRSRDW